MNIENEEKWESYVKALRAWYEGKQIQYFSFDTWLDNCYSDIPFFNNRAWRVKPKTKTLHYMNVLCTPKVGNPWVDVVNSAEELEDLKTFYIVKKLSDWQTAEVECD